MNDSKYNITDTFNVTFNNYQFYCSKHETIKKDDDTYDGWVIKWNKGESIKGTIHLPLGHARTSVFQILDGFRI